MNKPPQRVAMQTPQRVDTLSTSNNTTAPRIVRQAKCIHQHTTHSNTPMLEIPKEATYDNWYDNTRAPRREKRKAKVPRQASPMAQPVAPAPTFVEVPLTGKAPDPRVPMVSQHDEDDIINSIPRGLGVPMQIPVPPTAPPRRSPRTRLPNYIQANATMFICQEALYKVLAHALEKPKLFTPDKLKIATLNIPDGDTDLQEFCGGVTHPDTGKSITSYQKLLKIPSLRNIWTKAMCKELVKISQGYGNTKGTNTVSKIPGDRTVTYARIVVDDRAQTDDPNRVRITISGNLIIYPDKLTTRTADLTTTKLMWNSVISTDDIRYMCADIKSFYLETPLDQFEYTKMSIDFIPQEFCKEYDLDSKAKGGYVYMKIQKGMYSLP